MSCDICCNNFTQTARKPITCPYCEYVCCMSCFKTYLLGLSSGAICMNTDCTRALSNDFIASVTPKSFHNTTYREHRTGIALSAEISLLPASQHLVENKIKARKITQEIEELRREERTMALRRRMISSEKYRKESEVRQLRNRKDTVERRTFVRACPVNECRGFLSTAWKCGTCESYTCPDCHIPKNGRDDPEHECNPDDVATATLLAKDTKPCPKCAVPIYKISGCDQMWCTSCMTQFSWSRGDIISGHNHNPHYYQWIRERNNGSVPRTPGDGAPFCVNNDLPDYYTLRAIVQSRGEQFPNLGEAHRQIRHIQYIVMPRYPAEIGVLDNSDLRVSYLAGEISQISMKSQLQMRIKKGEKNTEVHQVLDMFVNTMSDLFRAYSINSLDVSQNSFCDQVTELRTYANRQLQTISKRYNNGTPRINWG
jgi:hypothetical protein